MSFKLIHFLLGIKVPDKSPNFEPQLSNALVKICQILRLLNAWIKIHQILISFETTNHFYFKCCIKLQCHETQLLCTFLAQILYTFNKKSLSWHNCGEIKSLKFGTLMGSFCQNNIKLLLKKYKRFISLDTEEWCEV